MARAIDGELLELEIANIANKLAKSDAQKALMGRVMYCVEHMPTLTPPNEWVSVEERSPKLRENVLVCAYWHEHWGVYMGWNSGHGWYVSCGLGQRSDVKVSHWMPLPAPPDRRPPEEDEDA